MNHTAKPDKTPWDKKTPDQRAKCVLDHLAQEFASGNLRPVSEQVKDGKRKPNPNPGKP